MRVREMKKFIEDLVAAGPGGGAPEPVMWKPPYGSLKAAVSDPALTVARTGLNGGMLYLTRVYVPEEINLTRAHWISTVSASGLTLVEVGVYNSDMELLGRTGDVKNKFMGLAGPNSEVLTPVRSLQVGGEGKWVYVGHYQSGTTRAGMAGHSLPVSGLALLDGSPPRCTTLASVAALPDVINPLDIAAGGSTQMIWYGLS